MTRSERISVNVAEEADVVLAGRRAKATLSNLSFDDQIVEEVVLVVHELASNIVKHAGEGSVSVAPKSAGGRRGIEVHARDTGPGIADVDRAVVDGYSTAGSLGGGLGAVHRLMDDVVIHPDGGDEAGAEIVATRFRSGSSADCRPPLTVGAATRAKPGQDENGDAFLVDHSGGQTLVGVIDGLGHGQAAHRAATEARQYVRTQARQSLADHFAGVERVCNGTRGVVMFLARFDWASGEVSLGNVGNITLRVCHASESPHLVVRRGVLGSNAPDPIIETWDWDPASVFVAHSDGIRPGWRCSEVTLRGDAPAADVARELLQTHSTRDDDATVLVISGDSQ